MDLHSLPKAPRRFEVINDDEYIGKPSVPYGVIRRLAHEQRKARGHSYLRVLYGEAGRNGDPWGGLELEVNGDIYHFNAGVKRWPEYHDGSGNLTEKGKHALATGVPGNLTTGVDWRWVQEEVNLTSVIKSSAVIQAIADNFRAILEKTVSPPTFQAQTWAKRLDVPINPDYHNCTTIILNEIRQRSGIDLQQRMPLKALDALQQLVGDVRSQLDDELNYLLSLPEDQVGALLKELAGTNHETPNWIPIAKGAQPIPAWLQWDDLPIPREG